MTAPVALWVRRCDGCGDCDLDVAVGSEALLGPGPWRCRRCGAPAWAPARLPLPDDRCVRAGR